MAHGVGEIGSLPRSRRDYHATGVRVRELPIKIEDLLTSSVSR